MAKKYYKVINKAGTSYNVRGSRGTEDINRDLRDKGMILNYSTEFVTRPVIPNSKLFCFDSLEAAIDFMGYSCDCEIWEVKVTGAEHFPYYDDCAGYNCLSVWRLEKEARREAFQKRGWQMEYRLKTIAVSSIRLIKRVDV